MDIDPRTAIMLIVLCLKSKAKVALQPNASRVEIYGRTGGGT